MKPDGWKAYLLEDDIELISGRHIPSREYSEHHKGTPYLTGPSDFQDGNIVVTKYTEYPQVLCDENDTLITVKGSGTGQVVLSDGKYCISRQLMAVRAKTWNKRFIYYFLYLNMFRYSNAAKGLIPGITREDVLFTPILLPPLPEQHKIVEILSTWDKAITLMKQHITALKLRKKGLMQCLLKGEVRFPEFIESNSWKTSRYGVLPGDWDYKTIIQIGENNRDTVQTGPFGAQLHASDYVDEGIPLILIRNIDDNKLNTADIPKISKEDATRLNKYSLQENDIVFSRVGRVGSCFLARREHIGWIISGQTLRIRLPPKSVNFDYLSYTLHGENIQRQLIGTTIGSTRKSTSTKVLEELAVCLPGLHEQKKIACVLKACDQEIDLLEQKLKWVEYQKKGLMQRLLTGEIRVQVT